MQVKPGFRIGDILAVMRRAAVIFAALPALVVGAPRSAAAQFTPFSHDPNVILEGSWQSCFEADGRYNERIYDHIVNGVGLFEVHLGPRREFAIFKGVQEVHRPHDSPENLLQPYQVLKLDNRASQHWTIPELNLDFTVTLAGGSRTDCESWFITLKPLDKTSH
jgi:hypothetical protein